MSFPSQPEQLTKEWLSTALGREITDFEVELFGEGAGIIGQVTRVHLNNKTESIIAKFPSPSPENRAVAATYDMYGREVNFYREVNDSVSVRAPDCYHADYNPETLDFILLLEDLKDMRIDCDGDTILLLVDQTGPACHTGRKSCFYNRVEGERVVVDKDVLIDPEELYGKS